MHHRHPHPHAPSRRVFLRTSLGAPLVCAFSAGCEDLLGAQATAAPRYDLLIKGGRVIDPSSSLSAGRDVAIAAGKIARVAESIPAAEARQVLDARGKIVTPGLVDVHVHVYDGVAPLGIPADPNCIAKGVTTVLDAGSAGAHTFPGLRKYVINAVETRVFALLNISVVGQSTLTEDNMAGELLELRYADPRVAIRTIERNRDVILGVKVRLSENIAGGKDLDALKLARQAADAVHLPLMAHIGGTRSPLKEILALLSKGDVITHSFHGNTNGILDERGRVLPEVRAAVERGVHLDVGHGRSSFSFDIAEKAIRQELMPGTISSDVHQFNVNGPVFDLVTTLSKFMHLGMTLEQVVERCTTNPARTFAFPAGAGTLRTGAEADVSVFAIEEGKFDFVDSLGATRAGSRKMVPVATVKSGRIYGSASIPVVRV